MLHTKLFSRCLTAFLVIATGIIWVPGAMAKVIVYPMQEVKGDPRQQFPLILLTTILEESEQSYRLQVAKFPSQQERSLILLESGEIDVVWSGSNREREINHKAIKIPMYDGMFGWRVMLVKKDRVNELKDIQSKKELQKFAFGLGSDWPDVQLFKANKMQVVTTTSYESLFTMLDHGRFDYFPRSVLEVWTELERFGDMGIVLEPHIVIHYPYHSYYFVSKNNDELAHEIERGFKRLIESGKYKNLFQDAFGELIQKANLSKRRKFEFHNPG